MEGSKYRKLGWFTALASAALLLFGGTDVRADWLHGAVSSDETMPTAGAGTGEKASVSYVAYGSVRTPTVSHERENWHSVVRGMRREWEMLRHEAVETAVTLFFIRGGTPPPTPPAPGGNGTPPPTQSNTPPGGGDNPPPPGGNGENPPGDPGAPPTGTPEPASLLMALLGAGMAIGGGWRHRRRADRA